MNRVFALAVLFTTVVARAGHEALRHGRAQGFVKALEFKHRLRVCNAYPYSAALDVIRGKSERLTVEPMPYKACVDFSTPLQAGDKLQFQVGDASAGVFSVSDLPNNDAVLLLVIHRHDTLSTAASFESHVFANLLNAQVAIIDTYKGSMRATARITDSASASFTSSKKSSRSEELRYNSVVAVNPGVYEVELKGEDGAISSHSRLVALNRESYVVLRTGVEAQQGPSYAEELVVYPQSDAKFLRTGKSGVAQHTPLVAFLLSVVTFFGCL